MGGPRRLIVYDLDGTLADTRQDITSAANHLRRSMGLEPLPDQLVCGYVGLGLKRLVQNVLGTGEESQVEEGMRVYRAFYAEHMLDNTRLYPGARELLEHFRPKTQAVITNKPNPYSRQILEALGVAGYFMEIVAGDSGYAKKPDPASLKALLERERIAPGEALFIGDSPVDVATGIAAGVMTVAVTHGFSGRKELEEAGPDHLLSGFHEVLSLACSESW